MLFAGEAEARAPCPPRPQPLPPALDAVPARAGASESIGFAAEPWEHPGRAWVVRLSRNGPRRASVEILRLLRRPDCNLYDIDESWGGPISTDDYRAVAEAVAAWSVRGAGEEVVIDGTGLELRVRRGPTLLRRRLNHYGAGGAELSAIFRRLVERFVPESELPAEDWRRTR